MKSGLLLNVVVGKSPAVLKLFASENQTLLIRGDSFLVLNFGLHVFNRVTGFHLKRDGLACKGFHEDLHASPEPQHEVKRGLFLDVVVSKSSSILKLFSGEDESLLVWWDSFFVLDLGLYVFDSVARFNLKGNGLPGESLDEDLHDALNLGSDEQRVFFR
eukprot:CAMPEP_0196658778 /NCGR_PEP_ID=MMETSP1086-20130531/31463_1 /TAXON_ID=77921 /ORGANISM="Cyanoptyche  gloeocystis , Strain SAG4.97" /LENGTH=159 /DNA_ID=CAMNT_0041992507 /DNA_START=224 /DNA_END=703 /DNA_ORIENTATION=-